MTYEQQEVIRSLLTHEERDHRSQEENLEMVVDLGNRVIAEVKAMAESDSPSDEPPPALARVVAAAVARAYEIAGDLDTSSKIADDIFSLVCTSAIFGYDCGVSVERARNQRPVVKPLRRRHRHGK